MRQNGSAVCPNLCRRHYSITSPAEVWELLLVKPKTYWSGIGRDTVLHLKLEMMEGGKVVAWCWPDSGGVAVLEDNSGDTFRSVRLTLMSVSLAALTSDHVVPTPTLSRCLVTGHVNSSTDITLAI